MEDGDFGFLDATTQNSVSVSQEPSGGDYDFLDFNTQSSAGLPDFDAPRDFTQTQDVGQGAAPPPLPQAGSTSAAAIPATTATAEEPDDEAVPTGWQDGDAVVEGTEGDEVEDKVGDAPRSSPSRMMYPFEVMYPSLP